MTTTTFNALAWNVEKGINLAGTLQFSQLVHFLAPGGEGVIGAAFTAHQDEGEPYNAGRTSTPSCCGATRAIPPGRLPPLTREVLRNFATR